MLSLEEALLFKAVQTERENEQALQAAGLLGSTGGAAIGAAVGNVPHQIGRGLNAMRGHKPARFKTGTRIAGGLTGLILGGGLGAGTAAMMKQNEAGRVLGKVQAQGGVSEEDEAVISQLLSELYKNPSQIG